MEWIDGMQCSGVQWNGSMECNDVEWNGMNGPHMSTKKMIFDLLALPTISIFRKWLIFFSFCEARSKMVSKKRRATKFHALKNAFLLSFFNVFF